MDVNRCNHIDCGVPAVQWIFCGAPAVQWTFLTGADVLFCLCCSHTMDNMSDRWKNLTHEEALVLSVQEDL
jgi:hypothetical protein